MKVLFRGFNGKNHSWSIVSQNIARAFKSLGNDVDIFSTNGLEHFPEDLKPNLKGYVDEGTVIKPEHYSNLLNSYDINISYTAPKNFPMYLDRGKFNFGIWTPEFFGKNSLPNGFCKNYKYTTKILAPSNFTKDIFIENGIPKDHIEVVPHGYNQSFIEKKDTIKIKTDRKFKFLVNYGQLHKRKNISGVLDSWGKAFTDKDDVVLVAKLNIKNPQHQFEISWTNALNAFRSKYKNHAPIVVISDYLDDISDLYRSCNSLISFGNEGFNMPVLEAVVSRKIPVCLDKGPHLDFTNNENAVYVKCSEVRAPTDYQYWEPCVYAKMYQADTNDGAEKLRYVFNNEVHLLSKFKNKQDTIIENYSWLKVSEQILGLCK